jgi:23S rRNA pseudouridine1911/1915/1917 synthase
MVVEHTERHGRLDRYLADRFEGVSRSTIQRLIVECRIKVDGLPAKPTQTPRAGQVVTIAWPAPKATDVVAQAIPLEILHEDADLLVINKPADLVVHPSNGHLDGTIVNAVLHHCRGQLSGVGGVERPGIVHRLDLGTSGCLVIAKHDRAHTVLTGQFTDRVVEKIYQCVVCDQLTPEAGEIKTGIARHPTHRKRMTATPRGVGRFAWTTYRLLERLRSSTFVEAALHTGRTHQIRVHFQYLGFPILGDTLYGKAQTLRVAKAIGYQPLRQLLHARKLTLQHPRSRRWMEFNAPLPNDFKEALAALRESSVQ